MEHVPTKITAKFFQKGGQYTGFRISGHSNQGPHGHDIVCAGVTAMVLMTINTLKGNNIEVTTGVQPGDAFLNLLPQKIRERDSMGQVFIGGLAKGMGLVQRDFPEYIEIVFEDV